MAGDGRIAVVTGASAGIGVAIASGLAAAGWRVAIGARRVARLAEVASQIRETGGTVFDHKLDVASPASIAHFFDALEAAWGAPDAVVNNAGVSVPGLIEEVSPEELQREIMTNLLGPMWVSQRVIPAMRRARSGDLIFIGSDNSDNPRPFQAGYSASKAGIKNLVRVLAMELEGAGVRVANLRLGPTASDFGRGWDPDTMKRLLEFWQRFALLRFTEFLDPAIVADAIVHILDTPRSATLMSLELHPMAPRREEIP
jgi:NAD(P)-dependent dehydrogenase (short-subunit alcohol dehydrogenase family)